MKPAESENALKRRLAQPIAKVTAREGVAAMLAFYDEQRAEGAAVEEDGDMLLFEWGVYSFTGPESFQLSITRQFIVDGEDEPYQLQLTFHFAPGEALRALQSGNCWCHAPNELPAFQKFVNSSAALRAVADAKALRVKLNFEQC